MNKHLRYFFCCLLGALTGISNAQQTIAPEQLEKLNAVLQIVNYAYVDSVKSDQLVENAINGILQ